MSEAKPTQKTASISDMMFELDRSLAKAQGRPDPGAPFETEQLPIQLPSGEVTREQAILDGTWENPTEDARAPYRPVTAAERRAITTDTIIKPLKKSLEAAKGDNPAVKTPKASPVVEEKNMRPADWKLDEQTKALGRAGVAAARQLLRGQQNNRP